MAAGKSKVGLFVTIGVLLAGAITAIVLLTKKSDAKDTGGGTGAPTDPGAAPSGSSTVTSTDTRTTAPTTKTFAPGESSTIQYISPRVGGYKVTNPNQIEVSTTDGLFSPGDVVHLDTYDYQGDFVIAENWDRGDGSGTNMINTKYIGSGNETQATAPGANPNDPNYPIYKDNPIDHRGGTITLVAEPTDQASNGADGKVNAIGGGKRYFSPAEAALRKQKKIEGKAAGLKGPALKNHIRTAAHAYVKAMNAGKKNADGNSIKHKNWKRPVSQNISI